MRKLTPTVQSLSRLREFRLPKLLVQIQSEVSWPRPQNYVRCGFKAQSTLACQLSPVSTNILFSLPSSPHLLHHQWTQFFTIFNVWLWPGDLPNYPNVSIRNINMDLLDRVVFVTKFSSHLPILACSVLSLKLGNSIASPKNPHKIWVQGPQYTSNDV